jgi:hypothetical protein
MVAAFAYDTRKLFITLLLNLRQSKGDLLVRIEKVKFDYFTKRFHQVNKLHLYK